MRSNHACDAHNLKLEKINITWVQFKKPYKIEPTIGIEIFQEIGISCIKVIGQYRQCNLIRGPLIKNFQWNFNKIFKSYFILRCNLILLQGQNKESIDFSGLDERLKSICSQNIKMFCSREENVSLANDTFWFPKHTALHKYQYTLDKSVCVCICKRASNQPWTYFALSSFIFSVFASKKRQVFCGDLPIM